MNKNWILDPRLAHPQIRFHGHPARLGRFHWRSLPSVALAGKGYAYTPRTDERTHAHEVKPAK